MTFCEKYDIMIIIFIWEAFFMKIKKLAAILAAFSIGITVIPVTENILPETSIFARADEEIPTSGTCGAEGNEENVTWHFDEATGILTIAGVGKMKDYDPSETEKYWYDFVDKITEVIIENGVTYIGFFAFASCSNLTSVTLPDSVTSIGERAFAFDSGLTSVTLPDSVTNIGDGAFYGCSSLTSVTIPDGVTSIGFGTFCVCTSLTSVTLPDSVTSIGPDAFHGCGELASITLPDGVTSIGDGAFYWCGSLAFVTIPDSVTYIGYNAFWETPWLYAQLNTQPFAIANHIIFSSNSGICTGDIVIPDGVTTIGCTAFDFCTGLSSVILPDSVTRIDDHAFEGCSGLTSITIPDSVTYIDEDAFDLFFEGTIYGYENSAAQAYAEKRGYSFQSIGTAPEHIQGDADGDGAFSVADIIALQKFLLNAGSLKNDKNCDYLKDDIIDIYDLALMKNALLAQ